MAWNYHQEKYGVEGVEGFLTDDIDEARGVAMDHKSVLIAYSFEFTDSEMIEDFREKEENER